MDSGNRRRALTVAGVVLALAAVPATAGASIAEFTGLTAGAPAGIAAGPGGDVWFTQKGATGGLGRMTTAGSLTEYVAGVAGGLRTSTQPADIAAGPDGALWFTQQDAIGRIDPATGATTEFTVGLTPNSDPGAITAGPDGNLWFTEGGMPAIARITPAGVITEFTAGLSGGRPNDIAAGPDGKLWYTASNPDVIGRIDPATGAVTEYAAGLAPTGAPEGIVAASSGKLFFTEPGAGRVGRIKTDGKVESYTDGLTAGAQPSAITEGGDGALWFTDADEPGRLGRLWPDTGQIQELTGGLAAGLSLGDAPGAITRGPDGNVWFTQPGLLPRIVKITVPPRAEIKTPAPAGDGGVRLKASIRANSQATTYFFEYGPTTAYGSSTVAAAAGDAADALTVSADVALARDSHYHARVTAVNASGTAVSSDNQFYVALDGTILKEKPPKEERVDGTSNVVTTQVTPEPIAAPEPALLPEAPPVIGETVSVTPVSGSVRVKPPGASGYLPLAAGASIDVGSLIDTRRGKVRLRSALDTAGRTQKGQFWGAIFKVRQARGTRGMTDLVLRGGNFDRCRTSARGSALARAAGATRDSGRSKVVRRLWGKDRHARFRTHGRDSAAAVRGTVWSTTDRCDGTMTRVKQGKVLVRDLRRKRSVLLRAGESYLARHRR